MLDRLVSQFGFSFEEVVNLQNVPSLAAREDVVAVIFRPSNLGLMWDEALSSVMRAFPSAFPILCHGFADHIDWPRAADAGAFHSIPVPFNIAELRQSLGFVWAAKQKAKAMRSGKGLRPFTQASRLIAAGALA